MTENRLHDKVVTALTNIENVKKTRPYIQIACASGC